MNRIEVERAGNMVRLVENEDSKKPVVIANAASDYLTELLDLAAWEVKRRGHGWALANKTEEGPPP